MAAMRLTAPEPTQYVVLEPDIYPARIQEIQVEDWTQTPDKFGKKGHYTLAITFGLTVPDEDGTPTVETRRAWITVSLHEKATLPKLIAALGLDPLSPGDEIDYLSWIGSSLRIGIEQKAKTDGTFGDSISAYYKAAPKKKGKPAPTPVDEAEEVF